MRRPAPLARAGAHVVRGGVGQLRPRSPPLWRERDRLAGCERSLKGVLGGRDADADEHHQRRDHDDPGILFHEGHGFCLQVVFTLGRVYFVYPVFAGGV